MKNIFRLGWFLLQSAMLGFVLGNLLACCTVNVRRAKFFPEYKGVDPKAMPIVNDYLSLANLHGIKFDNTVTVGFKDIKDGDVIGECHYGSFFREIDIDNSYWRESSEMMHLVLLRHELTHCYCNRDHDFGDGQKYKEKEDSNQTFTIKKKNNILFENVMQGYFKDGCPVSIMTPVITDDWCAKQHYGEYTEEMFNRCRPY